MIYDLSHGLAHCLATFNGSSSCLEVIEPEIVVVDIGLQQQMEATVGYN